MTHLTFRLPGRTSAHRVVSAVAVFALFYLGLLLLSLITNSWISSGESFVRP